MDFDFAGAFFLVANPSSLKSDASESCFFFLGLGAAFFAGVFLGAGSFFLAGAFFTGLDSVSLSESNPKSCFGAAFLGAAFLGSGASSSLSPKSLISESNFSKFFAAGFFLEGLPMSAGLKSDPSESLSVFLRLGAAFLAVKRKKDNVIHYF